MRITKTQLKQIIKEAIEQDLYERSSLDHPITHLHANYVSALGDAFMENLGAPMNKKLPDDVSQALNALNELLYNYVAERGNTT
jgi:hypothetical protein